MRSERSLKHVRNLERKFWISTATVTFFILVLTVLDAYFWGFR